MFIGRTDAEVEAPILWPRDGKNWLVGKDPDAGKEWKQEKNGMTENEMVGWHHWLDGQEFKQDPGADDGQGSLVCYSPWGCKESDRTERLNWTETSFQVFFGHHFCCDQKHLECEGQAGPRYLVALICSEELSLQQGPLFECGGSPWSSAVFAPLRKLTVGWSRAGLLAGGWGSTGPNLPCHGASFSVAESLGVADTGPQDLFPKDFQPCLHGFNILQVASDPMF